MVDIARVSSRLTAQESKIDHAWEMVEPFRQAYLALGSDASSEAIARYLNDHGHTTNLGRDWHRGSVTDFITLSDGVAISMDKAMQKIEAWFANDPECEAAQVYRSRVRRCREEASRVQVALRPPK